MCAEKFAGVDCNQQIEGFLDCKTLQSVGLKHSRLKCALLNQELVWLIFWGGIVNWLIRYEFLNSYIKVLRGIFKQNILIFMTLLLFLIHWILNKILILKLMHKISRRPNLVPNIPNTGLYTTTWLQHTKAKM